MKYPVGILADILSPGKYSVMSTVTEHVEEIEELEEKMKQEMQFDDTAEHLLLSGMYVGVKDFIGQLRRGYIKEKLNEDMYEVFLIDYGRAVKINKSNIRPITNKSFIEPEPLAFVVRLYGIIPTSNIFVGRAKMHRACMEWSPESYKFVKSNLKADQQVAIQNVLIKNRVVYGDLFFKPQPDMKFTSLRHLLCKQEFCTYSESNFLRLEGLSTSSESEHLENSETKTKMDLVNPDQEKTNEPSSAFSVPNACTSERSFNSSTSNESSSESFLGQPKSLGSGRGKLKQLIAEMKKNESLEKSRGRPGDLSGKTDLEKEKTKTVGKEIPPEVEKLDMHFVLSDSNDTSEVSLFKEDNLPVLVPRTKEKEEPKQSSKQNLTQSSKESYKQNFQESSKQNFNKSYKQNFQESSKQNFNESYKQNFQESSKQNFNKSYRQNFQESYKQNFKKSYKQNFQESYRQNFQGSCRQNFQGSYRQNFQESSKQNFKKSYKQNLQESYKQNLQGSSKQNFKKSYKQNLQESSKQNLTQSSDESSKQILPSKKPPSKRADPSDSETTSGSNYGASNFFKMNIKVWNQPLNLMKVSNSWGPYIAFDDTMIEPVNTFKELPIQLSIIQNLEREGAFCDLSQVQRWAIPAIRKQQSTVIIGSSKCGKTLSYIVPLIDYIQDSSYFEELPPGNGPFLVIVASTSRVCESIYYMCHLLLGNFTKMKMKNSIIKIILAHGNGCEKEIWVKLTNGCHILISTPHCLVRLLEYPILTNLERLTCLVLDEIDIISQNPFRKNIRIILEKAKFATKDRCYQCILTGERWTPNVESLVKAYVNSPGLIIGSSAEAVIFKKLKPNIHLVDRQQKSETLLNLLEDKIKRLKTLVVCEGRAEASRLHDFLTERGISSYIAHERIMADKLKEIHLCWKISMESVLITTDEVLNELNIREAQVLIHFELPSKSKTNFYLRYTTLEGFLCNANTSLNEKSKDLNVQSIILVDDENHRQLPHIVDFVTRLGGKIPSEILGKCEEIRRVIEIEKSDIPVCQNLLAIGSCRNSRDCSQRHALVKDLDSSTHLPTSGWVNFVFLKIQHASCFYVELVEHVDLEGKITKIENRRSAMLEKVAKYFTDEDNQRSLGMAKYGDICAIKSDFEDEEVFHRAKVVEILKVDKHGKALEVNVKLLDEGDIWKRKSTELFELPTDLSSHPPTATDVWIVGIQPKDFDVTWSAIANEFVSNLMSQELQNNKYWSGKIVLALNNTLFLDPIKRKEFLPLLKTHVFDLVVQDELLNKGIAIANSEHLPALLRLCTTGDIDVPKKEERKKDFSVAQPQSAFFDSDLIRVTFLAAENTSLIFLQPQKFKKLLQNLEKDCQKEAAEVISHKTKKSNMMEVTPGMFCLALSEDGKWNRGRVESENETQFHVFFIDHGDILFVSKTDVIPISQSLLLRLPAQAIECSLVGIHSEEKCSDDVLKEIYSFTDDGEEVLYAYIVDKDLEPSFTNGRKYKLNLLNFKGISLNKILVDKGMVLIEESERKYLEDIEMNGLDDDDEEEKGEVEEEEENFTKGGKNSWEDYFTNLTDDNEESLEFLKEFASKLLPSSTPFKAETPLQKPQIAYNPQEKVPVESEIQEKTQITSEMQQKKDNQEDPTPETQQNTQKNINNNLKLKTRENVLTPSVLWCQNQLEVQIKIKLGNVEDYNLKCTVHNFSFRCFVKEKFYAVDLKLFGAINPQMTKVTIKTFHVVVVLTKLSFPLWPRLHADEEKHSWINLDVENLADKGGFFSDKIQTVKTAIESGLVKKEVRSTNLKAFSDSEEDEINFEDEENHEFD